MTELTAQQRQRQEEYGAFVEAAVTPVADQMDAAESTPPELITALGARGYLGAVVPADYGGAATDFLSLGLLCHEIARGSASLLSLLTVQSMTCSALLKWGTDQQRARFLPRLARGEIIGAFALSEPDVGSDARNVQTSATPSGGSFRLNGRKKWISYAQVAQLYLVVAQCEGSPAVFLVERDTPGLECRPIRGMLGFRAAMLGELRFEDCSVPAANLLGRVGFGFSHVVGAALDLGRYCIAWGSTGLSQECLDLSLSYSSKRIQGGTELCNHQLIQRMIADMIADTRAARLLCLRAGALRDLGDPDSIIETSIAKYFASRTAARVSNDAVQIHGAYGCGPDAPVQRHFRDARITEIIEGSSQIQQLVIARSGYDGQRDRGRRQEGGS